ncbi:complex I 24 kDa subunit family protein [Spirochaeta africana]|uniref:NADH:ubiquinone oxidoreductase 24 kD subunit n=1 Tax=Spirochaeta africana (strain ATCC 700263 / DSM 8902 / Z-7692) TaxID=889378 RepID=H9UJW6_SPIAZ|nr:NAD(P)H-dependent oxidoreductase subunit E [Spirochaeta africana]AFG37809.1 NADH:ubiquinone oxidoreductase 24 kD subunit [Spirochaeta africana DSM 8902]
MSVSANPVSGDVIDLSPVTDFLAVHGEMPGVLIPVLQFTQDTYGYLPAVALHHISRTLHVPYSEVAGVVGFYSYFSTVPKGKHTIRVCLGTACYVRGGRSVQDALERELGIPDGGTTPDRCFSLQTGRCFGACGLAPVVMVDDQTHQRVSPARIPELISGCKTASDGSAAEAAISSAATAPLGSDRSKTGGVS